MPRSALWTSALDVNYRRLQFRLCARIRRNMQLARPTMTEPGGTPNRPVLARQQSQECFVRLVNTNAHHAPQLLDTASVATIPDHLAETRGAQPWMLLQRLVHRLQIGGPHDLGMLEAFDLNGAPYAVGVVFSRAIALVPDFPMLSVK